MFNSFARILPPNLQIFIIEKGGRFNVLKNEINVKKEKASLNDEKPFQSSVFFY
jgi:hypothetical protein